MSSYSDETRAIMRKTSKAADATAKAVSGLGSIMGLNGQVQQGGYLIGTGVLFNAVSTAADKWADDPPRGDYESATRPRPPLIREGVRAQDPVSELTLGIALNLDHADAELTASLRAFERYQGAVRATYRRRPDGTGTGTDDEGSPAARAGDAAKERATEAATYAHDAAPRLGRVAHLLEALAAEVPDVGSLPGLASMSLPVDQLPDGTLATLYLMGIPIRQVEAGITLSRWRPDVLQDTAIALQDASRHLADWQPPERV